MERDYGLHDDLIDHGTATVETRGPGGQPSDEFLGQDQAGLRDD